jgi:hypothetical protein
MKRCIWGVVLVLSTSLGAQAQDCQNGKCVLPRVQSAVSATAEKAVKLVEIPVKATAQVAQKSVRFVARPVRRFGAAIRGLRCR